jgi:hypothetical protein
MNAFARAAASLVADANMGLDVVYLPVSGLSFSCRVVLSRPTDLMAPRGISTSLMVSVPAATVANPERGDQIRIPSLARPDNLFTVEEVVTDPMRAMHDLTLGAH